MAECSSAGGAQQVHINRLASSQQLGAPMMDLLQAPAIGLLTSALAAPDLILSITIKKCV